MSVRNPKATYIVVIENSVAFSSVELLTAIAFCVGRGHGEIYSQLTDDANPVAPVLPNRNVSQ